MKENQGVRIVEMFSCGTIQIVKFLFAGDAQRHDLGPLRTRSRPIVRRVWPVG